MRRSMGTFFSQTLCLLCLGSLIPGIMAGFLETRTGYLTEPAAYRLEAETMVTAERLSSAVASSFALFDTSSILPALDSGTQGAGSDVILRRIVTRTIIPETGDSVEVTGLLAVPVSANSTVPVVSWQHGTILSFDQVPSNMVKLSDPNYTLTDDADSLETLFNIQRFAANGFAVIAADYIGKGPLRNGRGEAYVVKGATTQTCLDVLNAGLTALKNLDLTPTKLFLHGWSQGALNTQWLHQALRSGGVAIEATAVASPFSDLDQAWRYWSGKVIFPLPEGLSSYAALAPWIAPCMIVALGSYELYYDLPGLLATAVRPQYRELAERYWNDYNISAIHPSDAPNSTNLLVDSFWKGYTNDQISALQRQLISNTAINWDYDSPIRFYYGLADAAIHPAMVTRTLAAGGRFTEGIHVANGSHRATFLAGLYGDQTSLDGHDNVLSWFQSKLL
ncbi:hypothetical protein QBC40DRAFT_347882 [Triangularia verruculosa]|uniref:Uncharacterized protein n=1 Tax=Triangularia verruculosa TaxID=2587418 RepID=A0AAN6XLN9_9PEZI|nr:hypothetical protein QBC40DRAFT_347882 [Triangularia verruculosa]